MKCIDDELIQRYIDGETDIRETEHLEKHIAVCSSCAHRIAEKKALANAIKLELQKMGGSCMDVPEFTLPDMRRRRLNIPFKRIAYIASAACIALCMLFVLLPERPDEETEHHIRMYSVITDFDANRTFSQQETSIFVIDSDGKIIEYYN